MNNVLINGLKHFCVIIHHKWEVLKLSIKIGIPIRGLVHDLSKFSLTEFVQGSKYYAEGRKSPISLEKKDIGYSKAWLHHKGRNKHHPEYWYDNGAKDSMPIIPFKYICEMICDQLAAGIVYEGKTWTKEHQLKYWSKQKIDFPLNDNLKNILDELYLEVAKNGIEKVITKQNLKRLYEKNIK